MQWQYIGKSEQGTGHIVKNIPCQDSWDCQTFLNDQVAIGAVSDGMGSAKYSEIGSQIAVREAILYLEKNWLPNQATLSREFFQKLLHHILEKLKQKSKQEGYSIRELSCTLLVFVATPRHCFAMQVGDGFIVVRRQNPNCTDCYELLFQPQKGEYANVTIPVTSSKALTSMKFNSIPSVDFIAVSTDGIDHISLIKGKVWKPYDRFFASLENQILHTHMQRNEKEKELASFLASEQVNNQTDDDKTLLLCWQTPIPKLRQPSQNRCNVQLPPAVKSQNLSNEVQQSPEDINESGSLDLKICQAIRHKYPEIFDVKISGVSTNTLEITLASPHSLNRKKVSRLINNFTELKTGYTNVIVRALKLEWEGKINCNYTRTKTSSTLQQIIQKLWKQLIKFLYAAD